jgi:sensor histidine kinase YesM
MFCNDVDCFFPLCSYAYREVCVYFCIFQSIITFIVLFVLIDVCCVLLGTPCILRDVISPYLGAKLLKNCTVVFDVLSVPMCGDYYLCLCV